MFDWKILEKPYCRGPRLIKEIKPGSHPPNQLPIGISFLLCPHFRLFWLSHFLFFLCSQDRFIRFSAPFSLSPYFRSFQILGMFLIFTLSDCQNFAFSSFLIFRTFRIFTFLRFVFCFHFSHFSDFQIFAFSCFFSFFTLLGFSNFRPFGFFLIFRIFGF